MRSLPIDSLLNDLKAALTAHGAVVLVAPPGAGKTTRVPPALLTHVEGQILVLEPRRVAARTAARRMAHELGCDVGDLVGYQVRFDRVASDRTRILVVTEGILTRRLQDDPFLEGVGAVILDEFHERSLHADLGLALVHDMRKESRPELALVVMSATLDPGPIAEYLGAPTLVSEGREFPVNVIHVDTDRTARIDEQVALLIRRALRETEGDVLVFLPGAGEIARTDERLAGLNGIDVVRLYGDLPAEQQDRALMKGPRRKVILSTNVAETSVTIEGVRCVIDSGWVRELHHDPWLGMDRLELRRISRASADQRTGRAGRTSPGVAYRMWSRGEEPSMDRLTTPEIRRVDLARTVLELAAWGITDPLTFGWLDAPDPADVERGIALCRALGALDANGRVTTRGQDLLRLPLHPRLGALILEARQRSVTAYGCLLAALMSERDIIFGARSFAPRTGTTPTGSSDVLHRLDLYEEAERTQFRNGPLQNLGLDPRAVQQVRRTSEQLKRLVRGPNDAPSEEVLLKTILAAWPDRVARRRAQKNHGEPSRYGVMVGGRGIEIADTSIVREAPYFVVTSVDAGPRGAANAKARMISRIDASWLEESFSDALREEEEHVFEPERERVVVRSRRLFHDLVLEERSHTNVSPYESGLVVEAALRANPDAVLSHDETLDALRLRLDFLREHVPELAIPTIDDAMLLELLASLCHGAQSFEELRRHRVSDLLLGTLHRAHIEALAIDAPTEFLLPSGRRAKIRYESGRPPVLSARVQHLFGQKTTPSVARGRVPCLVEILAPNQRPVQLTQDLASFWQNTYALVRKDLRGRYPKHAWPERPE